MADETTGDLRSLTIAGLVVAVLLTVGVVLIAQGNAEKQAGHSSGPWFLGGIACLVLAAVLVVLLVVPDAKRWLASRRRKSKKASKQAILTQWDWEQSCESMRLQGEVCAFLTLRSKHGEKAQQVTCTVVRDGHSSSHQTWGGTFLPLSSTNREDKWNAAFPVDFTADAHGDPRPRLFDGRYDVKWTAWESDPEGIEVEGKPVTLFEGAFTWPCEASAALQRRFDPDLSPPSPTSATVEPESTRDGLHGGTGPLFPRPGDRNYSPPKTPKEGLAAWAIRALLRWPKPGRGGPIRLGQCQIARASSANASARREAAGTSVSRS